MAKSARSSRIKNNNRRKYASVFSPVELARNERLSKKLMELARQPKPESSDVNMEAVNSEGEGGIADATANTEVADENAMEVDVKQNRSRIEKRRSERRKQKKSSIVFPKYGDRAGSRKKSKSNK